MGPAATALAATAPPATAPAAMAPAATAPPAMVLQAMVHPAMVPKNLLLWRNLKPHKMLSGALELRIGEGGQISNARRPTGRKREERREMPQFTENTPR